MKAVSPYFRIPPSLACIAFLAFASFQYGNYAWKKALSKNGITIETRAVSGSDYKEFKATMIAKTTLKKAIAVMEDIPGYAGWMKDCKEARQLTKLSATSGIIYSLQSTPWPIAAREAVVQYSYRKTTKPAIVWIAIEAAPNTLPFKPGHVRISQLKGYWKFFETVPGSVEITYSLHSEPGGNLPAWAVSGMVAHLPYETLSKLRDRLEN